MTRRLARLADIAYRRRGRMVLAWKNNNYSILPGGYTAYDTAVSGSPGTMEIAGRRYSMGPCEDPARSPYGCSAQDPYFRIVAVNAADPSIVVGEHAYGVDTAFCDAGGQSVGELEQYRMATDLVSYVGDPSRLVFVQSVGQRWWTRTGPCPLRQAGGSATAGAAGRVRARFRAC